MALLAKDAQVPLIVGLLKAFGQFFRSMWLQAARFHITEQWSSQSAQWAARHRGRWELEDLHVAKPRTCRARADWTMGI